MFARTALRTPSIAAAAALPSSRSSPMVSTRRAPSASAAAKAKAPLSTSVKKTTAKKSVAAKSSAGGDVPTSSKKGLVVGGKFPSLGKLETDEGTFVDLDEVLKTQGIALFSYPKANTSGCTVQAIGFNDNHKAFADKGYAVFGISADSPTTQANWRAKHSFQYNLLCDRSFEALKKLGWAKSGGGVVRSHALIEKGGTVKDVQSPVSSKDSVGLAVEAL